MNNKNWYLPITLVFVFLGLFLSLQYQAQTRVASDLGMQRTENLIAMVRSLSEKRLNLHNEVNDLSRKLTIQVESSRDEKRLLESLNAEINKLNIVSGVSPVKGPGLIINIRQDMPILYIDIIDIVNELWAAGAEAIAINDQRITGDSSIFYAEGSNNMFITVNNHRIDFPIIITALGDSNNLEKGLTLPGGIIDRLALYMAYPELLRSDSLTLPPLRELPIKIFMTEYKAPVSAPASPAPEAPKAKP